MAEVLATLATIASLVEAGTKIAKVTTKITKSIRNATSEVKAAHEELEVTISVLGQFKSSLSQLRDSGDEVDLLQDSFIETINKSNDECTQIFDELKFTLEKAMPGVFESGGQSVGQARKWDQFRWPLTKTEVEKVQVRLQKVQEDMKGHAGFIDLAITTYRYKEDKKWAREEARYKYNLIKSQIREAGLRAKHAKLNMARLQTGRSVLSNGLQRHNTMQSNEDGSVVSAFVASLDNPRLRYQRATPHATVPSGRSAVMPQETLPDAVPTVSDEPPQLLPAISSNVTHVQNGHHVETSRPNSVASKSGTITTNSSSRNQSEMQPVIHPEVSDVDQIETEPKDIPHEETSVELQPTVPQPQSERNESPHVEPQPPSESIPGQLHVHSVARNSISASDTPSKPDKQMLPSATTPIKAGKSRLPWWKSWRNNRKESASKVIEPGTHYALLLTRASSEWQAYTLRISEEEVGSVVQAFKAGHKMIWKYYSRIAPEQVNMIDEACENACAQLTNGNSCEWIVVAIELVPKRSRGADIRSIKLIFQLKRADDRDEHVRSQDEHPGPRNIVSRRWNVNRRTQEWTADQANRSYNRLDDGGEASNVNAIRLRPNRQLISGTTRHDSTRPNNPDTSQRRGDVLQSTTVLLPVQGPSRPGSTNDVEVRRVQVPLPPPPPPHDEKFTAISNELQTSSNIKGKPELGKDSKPLPSRSNDEAADLYGLGFFSPEPEMKRGTNKKRAKKQEVFSKVEVDQMIAEAVASRERQVPTSAPAQLAMRRQKKSRLKVGFWPGDIEIVRRPAQTQIQQQSLVPNYFPTLLPNNVLPVTHMPSYQPIYSQYDYYRPTGFANPFAAPMMDPALSTYPSSENRPTQRFGQADFLANYQRNYDDDQVDSSGDDLEQHIQQPTGSTRRSHAQRRSDKNVDDEDGNEGQEEGDAEVDEDNVSRNSDALSRITLQSGDGSVVGNLIRQRLNITVPSDFGGDDDEVGL